MMGERQEWYAYLGRLNLIIVTLRKTISDQRHDVAGIKTEGPELDIEVGYLLNMECVLRRWLLRRQFVLGFLSRYPLPPELEAYYDNLRDGLHRGEEGGAQSGSSGGSDPICDSAGA